MTSPANSADEPGSRSIAAVILAAGRSSRMGTPKALLTYQQETFLARLVRVLGHVCDPVTVVLGHHAETLRPHVPSSARVAVNPEPDRGQLSSLQTALASLPSGAAGFAFIPVDCPAVAEETVLSLAQAFHARQPETLFVIPRGRHPEKGIGRGHPVFAAPSIAEELLTLPPDAEARQIVHAYVGRTQYVEVDDPGIFTDIDDPAAYQRLTARSGDRNNH